MKPQTKIEFLLPLTHNNGEDIDLQHFLSVKEEIISHFGGISTHPGTVAGIWQGEDQIYYDNCYLFEVSAPRSDQTKIFFRLFKEKLKKLFNQHEIYMTAVEIERF